MNILFVSFWKKIGTPANPNAKYTVALLLRGKASSTSFASNVWLGMSLPIIFVQKEHGIS